MTRYLTPGWLVRHIADVTPAPLYGPTAVEIEALCAGRRTIALWDSVGSHYAPADEEIERCPGRSTSPSLSARTKSSANAGHLSSVF